MSNHLKHFTSFHFETNDQIEIINNDFKKYLKIYCNYQQNDWYDWLSFVEFEINFVSSSFTTIISFLIIKNYISRSKLKFANFIEKISNAQRQMKIVDEFVKKMIDFQKFLRAKLIWTQTKQKKQINKNRHSIFELKIKNKIMFDVRYIQIMRFNKSLNHKNLNFYVIKKIIHNIVYELKFFESMKSIFSMFHSWLLHSLNDDSLFDQHISNSSSIIIKNEFEWEINRIVNFRLNRKANDSIFRKKNFLQYRVKYKKFKKWNQRFEWQFYDDLKNVAIAVTQFHENYSKKFNFHAIYKLLDDWISTNVD